MKVSSWQFIMTFQAEGMPSKEEVLKHPSFVSPNSERYVKEVDGFLIIYIGGFRAELFERYDVVTERLNAFMEDFPEFEYYVREKREFFPQNYVSVKKTHIIAENIS